MFFFNTTTTNNNNNKVLAGLFILRCLQKTDFACVAEVCIYNDCVDLLRTKWIPTATHYHR